MSNHNIILLRCPHCKEFLAAETDVLIQSETVFCPHCHRESGVYEVLNRKNKIRKSEQLLAEMQLVAQNISEIDINKKIGQLHRKYNISPIVLAFILNCLLEEHPIEDFPPLFVEYEDSEKVSLSFYLNQLDKLITDKIPYEPEISVSAHISDAMEILYQHRIDELEQSLEGHIEELHCTQRQIEELHQQIDDKEKEIRELKDKVAFLKLKK